jgi:hypothetical protein
LEQIDVTALALDSAVGGRGRGARRLAGAWLLLVALGLALAALGWLVVHEPQRTWSGAERYGVILEDGHYRVDARQWEWLRGFSALHFQEGEQAARALAAAHIDASLDAMFAGVAERLPEFADWYYSLPGEYARLSMLALSWVDLAEDDFVGRRAAAILFPDGAWEVELDALEARTVAGLADHQARVREGWLAELTERLSGSRVPQPLPDAQRDESPVRIDVLLEQMLARERAALTTRASISALAAGGAAIGPVVWRAASRRIAVTAGRPAAARIAGRGAARAGSAAAGSAAAGGAAVCAPGGPLALGCAVIAGTAAWVAADWALLRLDEALHREEMLAALAASLERARSDLQRDLVAVWDAAITDHYGVVQQEISASFVPARAR